MGREKTSQANTQFDEYRQICCCTTQRQLSPPAQTLAPFPHIIYPKIMMPFTQNSHFHRNLFACLLDSFLACMGHHTPVQGKKESLPWSYGAKGGGFRQLQGTEEMADPTVTQETDHPQGFPATPQVFKKKRGDGSHYVLVTSASFCQAREEEGSVEDEGSPTKTGHYHACLSPVTHSQGGGAEQGLVVFLFFFSSSI